MRYALNLAPDGRVLSATFEQYAPMDAVKVSYLPEGNLYDYRYENDAFVYDPVPVSEEPENPEDSDENPTVWDELATAYMEGVNSAYEQ